MAKKDKGKKYDKQVKEQAQAQATQEETETVARLQVDDGPTLAVDIDGHRPWLDPDRPDGPGPQDTTDPRTQAAPPGADKPDQSLQEMVGKVGDRAIPTGPNLHGLGSTFPDEKKYAEHDLLKQHDEKSLLAELELNPRVDTGTQLGGRGSQSGNITTAGGTEDTAASTSKSFAGASESDSTSASGGGKGGGQMGDLSKLPPGVELNANAPHDSWYMDDASGNTKSDDLKAFLGVGGEQKGPTAKEQIEAKKDALSGQQDKKAFEAWKAKTSPDGGTKKYMDPDYVEGPTTIDTSQPPPDPGAGISHTVNPLDDNPATIDKSTFDPKADPNAPYILKDPDAVDTPVAADTSQPPPDPGAGISHTVNPLNDPNPPLPAGGTPGTGPSGGQGGESTPASINADTSDIAAPESPQVAVQGEDFAAPDADAPGAAPELGAAQDLDGDGQPG